jgi:hypothetical protein
VRTTPIHYLLFQFVQWIQIKSQHVEDQPYIVVLEHLCQHMMFIFVGFWKADNEKEYSQQHIGTITPNTVVL